MMDRARVKQLILGVFELDIMFLQLRLRDRKEWLPTILALLNEIREAARKRIMATLKMVHLQEKVKLTLSVVKELKDDIQELCAHLKEGQSLASVFWWSTSLRQRQISVETRQYSEVHMQATTTRATAAASCLECEPESASLTCSAPNKVCTFYCKKKT